MLGAASEVPPSTWPLGTGRSSTGWVSSTSKLMSVLLDPLKICSEKVDCCFTRAMDACFACSSSSLDQFYTAYQNEKNI